MVVGDTPDAGGGPLPPSLNLEERATEQVERPLIPALVGGALVIAGRCRTVGLERTNRYPRQPSQGVGHQFGLEPRGVDQVDPPIEKGQTKGRRRDALCDPSLPAMQQAVESLRGRV